MYHFVCLPFGYSAAPRLFTKLLKPIYAWFRAQNIRCSYYIDDSLNMNSEKSICKTNAITICTTLESLGYLVNKEKSVLEPMQRIVSFGFILDSVKFMVYLTEEKIQKIILKATDLLRTKYVLARDLASFIGLLISAFYAVLEAPLRYRDLERCKISSLGIDRNFDNKLILDVNSVKQLNWWIENVSEKNGKRIRPMKVNIRCTDASLSGWSIFDEDSEQYANGHWSVSEANNHINYLELLAIFLGLSSLYQNVWDAHIHVCSDNVTAVLTLMTWEAWY